MLADFFTKPLQGTAFLHMCEKILNLPSSTTTAMQRSMLDNQSYEMTREPKQSGPEGAKRSSAEDDKVGRTYGTKISPTGVRNTRS